MIHSTLHLDRLDTPPTASLPYQGWPARFVARASQAMRSWWRGLWAPELRLSREWLADYERWSRKHRGWE